MAGPEFPINTDAIASWLHLQTLNEADVGTLFENFCARLVEGVAIERAVVGTLLFHPQFDARDFVWVRTTGRAERQLISRRDAVGNTPSPFPHLGQTGEQELRCRLEVPDAALPFPLLERLRRQGFTDYAVFAATFGRPAAPGLWPRPGAEGVFTSYATIRPGGFHDAEMAALRTLRVPLAVAVKAAATYEMAETLLCAYLGDRSGRSVLKGHVRRGQGEVIRAVLWHSDLRGSTTLAESASLEDYLANLNAYFDCVVDAVAAHGGEILKFMGDGVLAMFPFEAGTEGETVAAEQALAAAQDALQRLAEVNGNRYRAGEAQMIRCGIALHVGDAMYGNVGSARRLDFTVMGPAINEVCRLEALCKTLSVPLVVSETLATLLSGSSLRSLGTHELPGVGRKVEVFSLAA